MSTEEVMSIDLEQSTFTLESKKLGKTFQVVVREMAGDARQAFLKKVAQRTEVTTGLEEKDIKVRLTSLESIECDLLEQCLFDADDKPVSVAVFSKWPGRVLTSLYKTASSLNGLSAAAKAEAKKD